eukprot:3776880-Alexandrium_andersonii.AAC.1
MPFALNTDVQCAERHHSHAPGHAIHGLLPQRDITGLAVMSWTTEPVLNGTKLLCSSWRTGALAACPELANLSQPRTPRPRTAYARDAAHAGCAPGVMRRPRP